MKLICDPLRAIALVPGLCTGGVASAGSLAYPREARVSGSPRVVYTFDPATGSSSLRATKTGTERFLSLEKQPSSGVVVRKILDHLGLPSEPPIFARSRVREEAALGA